MRNDLTMVDDGDMVAKLLRLLQIMCGQEDRRSSLVEVDNALPELPAQLDVDAGGRLVEHQDRRIVDHRLGDQQPASHAAGERPRSEEHTSELQSLMRISYAVFCLKKKKKQNNHTTHRKQ